MKLFIIDEQSGRVTFAKDEFKSIKEFLNLIRKDKGGIIKGDPDGRLKYYAAAQFALIWWCNDPTSPGIGKGYNDDELLRTGLANYDLPANWIPTVEYKEAEVAYRIYRSSIAADTYIEILKAFRVLYKYIKFARNKIEITLDNPNITDQDWRNLEPMIKGLITLADEIPGKIKAIQKAKDLLDAEEASGTLLRGTKEVIPDSMIPGRDAEEEEGLNYEDQDLNFNVS